jgi:ATP-dependent DNA helicase RecQ
MPTYNPNRALQLLREGTNNPNATFRNDQEVAIKTLVEDSNRLLVVQKTGWGKSFVYFIAAKMLREHGLGTALLVSPLLSLMRNQIQAARRMGLTAETINSDNIDDWSQIEHKIQHNSVDILLISPERLANQQFISRVMSSIAGNLSILVIDEAHCISDWGHDFRPHYRLIERLIQRLPNNLRLLATTATANNRVMEDLEKVLGKVHIIRGDLNRPNLTLQTINLPNQAERLAWMAEHLKKIKGSGIIYALTIKDAKQVTQWLKLQEIAVESYSGQSENREELEEALLNNRLKALVSTSALGMGFDKPDLAFVIHYQSPKSVVDYYQQVGRAGRALASAYGILLSGQEEIRIANWFIDSAFPSQQDVKQILDALEHAPKGLSEPELLAKLNIRKSKVSSALKLLSLESPAPIAKEGPKYQLTSATLSPKFWQRAERLTVIRKDELAQMQTYLQLAHGQQMPFLIKALDGDVSQITTPTLPPLSSQLNPTLLQQAIEFLKRTAIPIDPRKIWPAGGLPRYAVKGKIAQEHQAQIGMALSTWGDAGWGKLVKQGKYVDQHFSDDLVTACVAMIKEWHPNPMPTWITCVPSLRHPTLVPDFANRLAQRLGLAFYPILEKSEHRPEQKTMANSAQQAKNVDGSLKLSGKIPVGNVFLVDDMVDSRWTLTVATWLLRSHGSGAVFPLVLADTGNSDD